MARKKNKNLCSKCMIKHSPLTGKKCAGLLEFSSGKATDTSGQEPAAGSSKNCKSPSKKNLTLKPTKALFQLPSSPYLASTGVKVKRKSAKDSGLLSSKKKQVQNSHKSSVQHLLASVRASDDSEDDVTLDKLLPSLTSKKKQVQNSQKSSVQHLLASVGADDSEDDVTLDKLLPSKKKVTQQTGEPSRNIDVIRWGRS